MKHITMQEDGRIRHEYYLDKDMEVPEDRRKTFCVMYEYFATDIDVGRNSKEAEDEYK